MAVGVLLVGFSGLVFALGRSPRLHRGWTRLVIVSDIGWVAGSAVLMTGWPIDITRSGLAVIGLVAAIVLLFADLQWLGLRRSQRPA
ncbi:MAG: hypothetical protein KJO07_04175 [Deltaproteobacteria bacterium]|jgi:hypothetical protein|nr:hypothetical protein [Deltaproteobacteria bacterium]